MKLAAPIIEDILLHLVNISISQSKYPQCWKVSKIIPHHKKGDRTNGENCRPVSNIVFVSKIVESAVFKQVFENFTQNNLWHPNHHGFRPGHSTVTALAQLQNIWIEAAEKRKLTAALLLDLSAAFDVLDHGILLEKLELYGLSGSSITWFKSYLEDRYQHVMVESSLSNPLSVGSQGVPEGSLFCQLCFLLFYNDFPVTREVGESSIC